MKRGVLVLGMIGSLIVIPLQAMDDEALLQLHLHNLVLQERGQAGPVGQNARIGELQDQENQIIRLQLQQLGQFQFPQVQQRQVQQQIFENFKRAFVETTHPFHYLAFADTCFANPTATIDRVFHAKSLAAKDAMTFKKFQNKAKIAAIVRAIIYGLSIVGSVRVRSLNDGFFIYSCIQMQRAIKRALMHKRYARHAAALHALMQDDVFTKELGVKKWDAVAKARIKGEVEGYKDTLIAAGSMGAAWAILKKSPWGLLATVPLFAGLSLLVKPIASSKTRRTEGGVSHLEKEFDAYVKDRQALAAVAGGEKNLDICLTEEKKAAQ